MSAKPAAQSAHSAVPASVLEVPTAHSVQLLDSSRSVPEKPAAHRHAEIEVAGSSAEAADGPGMLPVLRVSVRKKNVGAPRWDGFIRSVGEDSIL